MASKFHVSLDVNNLEESVRFYSTLFAATPTKVKPGYAKFDLQNPAINLTLEEHKPCCITGVSHMGVRVDSLEEVLEAKARLAEAGYKTEDEMNTTCCYAVQDKIWAQDPTGYRWEVYIFKQDSEKAFESPKAEAAACCTPAAAKSEAAAEPCCAPAITQAEAPAAACCAR
jgi:catechol 2,3-dioxygenase-like lactoylglutathione lyase family enzyme